MMKGFSLNGHFAANEELFMAFISVIKITGFLKTVNAQCLMNG